MSSSNNYTPSNRSRKLVKPVQESDANNTVVYSGTRMAETQDESMANMALNRDVRVNKSLDRSSQRKRSSRRNITQTQCLIQENLQEPAFIKQSNDTKFADMSNISMMTSGLSIGNSIRPNETFNRKNSQDNLNTCGKSSSLLVPNEQTHILLSQSILTD